MIYDICHNQYSIKKPPEGGGYKKSPKGSEPIGQYKTTKIKPPNGGGAVRPNPIDAMFF
ncbi:hypothetical protein NEICINOT_04566 [Neisseria cinerea ATCC 14685]|uniref:Uncharacterized protein n=1 Tax=Neisseria cinerea ATCC 14685 TaxID=546262 RepID=D0W4G7_NEICI|nr:hypothetical protein NEICINOT_04566 [Neisseria cinerea ATCC 14685]